MWPIFCTTAKPSVVFCSAEKHEFVKLALSDAGHQTEILVFENIPASQGNLETTDFIIDDIERTALIMYTSGTTGDPKGVMLSFHNLLTNITAVCHDVPIFTLPATAR